ncbi:MAG: hypothetical protein AAFR81_15110 [Chloroflexota bacterium]
MTKIKRLAPKKCPDCASENSLFIDDDKRLTCRLCGYKRGAEKTASTEETPAVPQEDRRTSYQVTYSTPYTPDPDRWAKIKYSTGMDYVNQGKWDEAFHAFEQACEYQRDFVDAHLWAARMTLDPDKKRYHYGSVIAQTGSNLEATRELMVLNGDLTREEADRAGDMSREADVQDAEHAVSTQLIEIVCSNCGGSLSVPHGSSEVTCQFCGHVEQIAQAGGRVGQSLTMAMITDRGKGTRWRVGKHLLHCDNCGAERVITGSKMTVQCPFCSSNHVIRTDALESFRQPDGIVPFALQRDAAQDALDNALNSFGERLKGIFVNNRADRIHLTDVFLPFWVFDVTARISRTRVETREGTLYTQSKRTVQRDEFGDGLNNMLYCGVESPSRQLTSKLRTYDLTTVEAYTPKLLANKTAELYSIDYQQASINVRSEVSESFRFKHGHDPHGDSQTLISSLIQNMSFRLLLLPVWVANIIEEDGDVRVGLIHGQTGQAFLGRATRPDDF